ncbi:MAG: hypothetical protein ACYC7E_06690 [Armatimonadota bacterium]
MTPAAAGEIRTKRVGGRGDADLLSHDDAGTRPLLIPPIVGLPSEHRDLIQRWVALADTGGFPGQ